MIDQLSTSGCIHTSRAVLSPNDTAVMVNISRSGIYRLLATGDFPRPIQLTPRRVGFRVEDVHAWLDGRRAAASLQESTR